MKSARVQFNLTKLEKESLNKNGLDKLELLFSSNKGIEPQPVSKIASGGEMSRLMLAIKYLQAGNVLLPTIIFDEIDLGISGEIALMVGKMIQKLARKHQILSITHLPQVAAMGNNHFYVYKDVKNNRSLTMLKEIEGDERVMELAKMIGGDKPGKPAIENAKELLINFAQN
jgi:DNA repair protein RecN (Recombination protein N)